MPTDRRTIWRYDWLTGDGYETSGRSVIYRYAGEGDFEVTLRVVDDHGAMSVANTTVRARSVDNDDDEDNDCRIAGRAGMMPLAALLTGLWLAILLRRRHA